MTDRDWFLAFALGGLLANGHNATKREKVIAWATEWADAMMERRKDEEEKP